VSELASLVTVLDEHLRSATVSKNTSKTIQNELLDCMYEVYKQTLMEEMQNANVVSIQADKTTDVSCMSQFVILLRYVKRDGPVEKFHSFVQVQNRTVNGLASVLKREFALAALSIRKDVIADTPRFNQKVIELLASQKNRRG
jgi:Ethanolamine utilization protein EutJ (predicted chaperonin)